MNDVPSFMRGMGDSPEDLEIMSPLRDDILKDEPEPAAPEPPKEPEKTETAPEKTETPAPAPTTPELKKEGEPVADEDIDGIANAKKKEVIGEGEPEKKEPEKEPEKTEPPKEPEKKEDPPKAPETEPEKKPDLTKAVEKASEAVAAVKDTPTEKQTELMKAVQLSQKVPLIFVDDFPKKEAFELEDGSFNLDGYMQAYTKSLIMGIQKSLAGGPLSASVFGILHSAMKEEQVELDKVAVQEKEDKELTAKATEMIDTLKKNYPRLGTDKDLEEAFDDMLFGISQRRAARVQAGEKLEPMTYEEVEKVLLRIIGANSKAQPAQTAPETDGEVTETIKGGEPMLNGGTRVNTAANEIDRDIDAMMRVKSKSLF